jgi:hypothetical protein
MKRALLSLGLLAIVAGATVSFQSCNKIKDEIMKNIDPFNFSQQSFELTIDPVNADSINTGVVTTNINLQDSINKYVPSGLSLLVSSVKEVRLVKVTVSPVSGFTAENNFTNVSDVAAMFNTNIGLNKQLWPVGIWTQIADNAASQFQPLVFDYTQSKPNIKEYFSTSGATEVKYYLKGKLRRPITQQMKVNVSVEYQIVP